MKLRNAPVKVNPDSLPSPPHPGICGALVGLHHHIGSSLSPQYVGDSRVLSLLSWGMWGIRRGLILIQDGGDRSHKDFWVYNRTWERTQVFTGICGICVIVSQINTSINLGYGFKEASALILRSWWLFVSLLRKDSLSECRWYNLWNVMTKVFLEINCWDSNTPVFAENFPFLENIFGLAPVFAKILLVFEILPC